jgi:SpoVK/Ycf46/Vps4 family AAA+-type ATPase
VSKNSNTTSKFKYKDLKIYGSAEWLANGRKKYRRVYDRAETTYIYVELSFYNKLFDEEDWDLHVGLKAFAIKGEERNEVCDIQFDKHITQDTNIVSIHQAWGNKRPGFFWKSGEYEWEAYLDGQLVGKQKFWVEDIGVVSDDSNPYFNIEALKLYEGTNENVPSDKRIYAKAFDARDTRYIFSEFTFQNLAQHTNWNCELEFKFYNDAHQLKGETVELINVSQGDKYITVTSGWGSNDKGTWFEDNYTLEVVFMDKLVAILPFEVGTTFERGMNEAILPGLGATLIPAEELPSETLEDTMKALDELIGLRFVKQRIREYAEYLKFLKIRMERGIEDSQTLHLHTVFTGNPGTGKTTVAKMLGQIYQHLGLLSKGHVIEVDRAELVGEYIGQTAPKVKEAIKQARGGILFIDEAYSLARTKDDLKDFGREVLEILIKEMSDGQGDIAIVVAGYPSEMKSFMDANPGLKSRFTQWFEFPDYMPHELADIAEFAAHKNNIILTQQSKAFLYDKIVEAYRTRDRYFGNARYIHTLIDQAKVNLGLRVMKTENPRQLSREDLSTITVDDLALLYLPKERRIANIPIDENLLRESLEELNKMPGLQNVKKEMNELVGLVRFYREMGKDVLNKFSLHAVFTGNPGTGKTTVARLLAKIFKALGILERGHLVECDRQNLVAGFVGQTAIKTAEKIDEAIGGVLFIDEAYALTERGNGGGNDFGREAIETLIKRMEDQKGEFAIVAAGYTENMKLFMEANPGLKSRIDRIITFDDYNIAELMQIMQYYLKREGFILTADAEAHLQSYFSFMHNTKDKYFGNGRAIVKTIYDVIKAQNLRLLKLPIEDRTPEIVQTITLDDVKDFDEKRALNSGRKSLGFNKAVGSAKASQ